MRAFWHSQASHGGRENQDCVAIRPIGGGFLVALADGQGGRAGGALAARLAVQTALDFLTNEEDSLGIQTFHLAISVADEVVEAEAEAGFSTLIALYADDAQVIGASVGDSQVWHIGNRDTVELSEQQRKNPPLGSGATQAVTFQTEITSGEQILVMSDGVFRFVVPERIAQICRIEDDSRALPHLLELQKLSETDQLPDDWSAVLLRF